MKIAKRTGQNVLSMDGEVASSGTTVSSTGPDGQVTEWKREEAKKAEASATPKPQEETVAPAEETRTPETESPPAEPSASATAGQSSASERSAVGTAGRASELPRTASPLPLSALIGLLSLGGAMALRRGRR